jgi:serine/threonine protein kinase
MHRDLKPANILVNSDCTIRICDFGLSRGVVEDAASAVSASALVVVTTPAGDGAYGVASTVSSATTTAAVVPNGAAASSSAVGSPSVGSSAPAFDGVHAGPTFIPTADAAPSTSTVDVAATHPASTATAAAAAVAASVPSSLPSCVHLPTEQPYGPATGDARGLASVSTAAGVSSVTHHGLSVPGSAVSVSRVPIVSSAAGDHNAARPKKRPPAIVKRQLTEHVVTRWYRPPEVILTQVCASSYSGCCFVWWMHGVPGLVDTHGCERARAVFAPD